MLQVIGIFILVMGIITFFRSGIKVFGITLSGAKGKVFSLVFIILGIIFIILPYLVRPLLVEI